MGVYMKNSRPAKLGLAGATLALLAVLAYAVTSLLTGGGTETRAGDPGGPAGTMDTPPGDPSANATATAAFWEHPGRTVTPEPGSTPDRSQPFWFVPYQNADRMKPRFEGELNGFLIEFGADDGREGCPSPEWLDSLESEGTEMSVFPRVLPEGTMVEHGSLSTGLATICSGRIVHAFAKFIVPAEPPEGRLGGSFSVVRMRVPAPVISSVLVPEDRWMEASFGGRSAVVARPILDELGLGRSAIAVYDMTTGILTLLDADGIPHEELMAVARSLFE